MASNIEVSIDIDSIDAIASVFGNMDENTELISSIFGVDISSRNNKITIMGEKENVETARNAIEKLMVLSKSGEYLDPTKVRYICESAREGKLSEVDQALENVIAVTFRGKTIKCKTVGQKEYVDAIRNDTIVFGEGPAGTGKTYIAVALAVRSFKDKKVDKIILTRPAVEAGEKLGFLPGDLQEKVNPYLRPLYDALQEMFGVETYVKLLEKGTIEIAPLAYMRGRTLSNAFIILDEAQNTTQEQMKMFLTRLGESSKMVVTGDLSQIDLGPEKKSGLKQAITVLKDVRGISIVQMTEKDVVRHPLVQSIVKAYERYEKNK